MKLLVKWFSEQHIDNKYIEKIINERLVLSDKIDIKFEPFGDNGVSNFKTFVKINLFLDKSDIGFYIEKNDNGKILLLNLEQYFMTKNNIEIWLRLDDNSGVYVLDRIF